MNAFTVQRGDNFVCHIYAARVEIHNDDGGCFFFYDSADTLIAGTGSRKIGIRIFEGYVDKTELLPSPLLAPVHIDDFYPAHATGAAQSDTPEATAK